MSSIIRIVVGVALLVGGLMVYRNHSAQIAVGGQVRIFGLPAGETGWLVPAFIVAAIIGLVFIGAGIAGLVRNRK
jgi:hypothetical protein